MYVIIGSHCVPLKGKFLLIALVIEIYKDNIKCDSVSNAPKCPLNNGVSIVQKLVVKLSNTSTMLFPPVAKTLLKCLRV
jgi:hypothetical protein